MPLSVTCQCGSRLDIDEKFLGKEILCPDCQRPLPTKAPPTPPPLDLPTHKRVSGLAVLTLTVALVGMFTVVGSIIAIILGIFAIRQINRSPNKLEGVGLARAGIILSAVFFWITVPLLIFPLFNVDVFLRLLTYTANTQAAGGDGVIKSNVNFRDNVQITRPNNDWRQYISPPNVVQVNTTTDDLIAINIFEDAFIACQMTNLDFAVHQGEDKDKKNIEDREKKAIERLCKSELVNLLGKLRGNPLAVEPTAYGRKDIAGDKEHEFYVDMRLGGQSRRFLVRWKTRDNETRLMVLVATARAARFERLEEDFRKAFDTVKFQ